MATTALQNLNADTSLSHREDGRRRRVLYAEDQATARVVTTALLERMGFEVVAVEDGELALEEARQGAYDIILLDIEMPVMDGVTAARSIRQLAGYCKDTPILALSAFLADSTEHCQWRDAFDSALPKPANSNELKKAMRSAFDKVAVVNPQAVAESKDGQAASLWASFGRGLPRGTVIMLVRTAHAEMNHLINCLAVCNAAGDTDGAKLCRSGLRSLAASFDVQEVSDLLANDNQPAEQMVPALLSAGESWRLRQVAIEHS